MNLLKTLTVIVPIYNEESSIGPFYARIRPILDALSGISWSLVFINDGSRDSSLEKIASFHREDPRVKAITLSRNFGYHAALRAGLSSCETDLYSIIDVDCEDPPELLSRFYEEIMRGAQTIYGDRSKRDESHWLVFWRWLFYWINQHIADAPVYLWMGEFCMITHSVRDAVLKNKTTFPFLRAELGYVGFKIVGVPYFRASRRHGMSHYNFYSMARFAIAGFLSSSTFPLRAILYFSGFIFGGYLMGVALLRPSLVVAAQVAMICSFFSLIISLPMIAVYLARIYKDVSARPLYCIDVANSFLDS